MNREDALARIAEIEAETAELRKLVTAEKKKEPRGLCWVWDGDMDNPKDKIEFIKGSAHSWQYKYRWTCTIWANAIPLTPEELAEHAGRWEEV